MQVNSYLILYGLHTDHCYNNNERFGRKSVVEEVCIPKAERNCLRLTFQAEHGFAEGAGFAVLIDGEGVFKHEDGGIEPVTWLPSAKLADECQVPLKQCKAGESLMVLALTLDRHEEEISWQITDTNYEYVALGKEYPPETAMTTVIEEVCVPTHGCVAFTVHDKYGDGKYNLVNFSTNLKTYLSNTLFKACAAITDKEVIQYG